MKKKWINKIKNPIFLIKENEAVLRLSSLWFIENKQKGARVLDRQFNQLRMTRSEEVVFVKKILYKTLIKINPWGLNFRKL